MAFRPGGGMGMASFAMGARPKVSRDKRTPPALRVGPTFSPTACSLQAASGAREDKSHDDVTKYDRAFMMAFKEVRFDGCLQKVLGWGFLSHSHRSQRCTTMPPEIEGAGSMLLEGVDDRSSDVERRARSLSPLLTSRLGKAPPSDASHVTSQGARAKGRRQGTRSA